MRFGAGGSSRTVVDGCSAGRLAGSSCAARVGNGELDAESWVEERARQRTEGMHVVAVSNSSG